MDKFVFKRPRLEVERVTQDNEDVKRDLQNHVIEIVDIIPVIPPQSDSHQLQHGAGVSGAKETNRPSTGRPIL